MQFWKVFTKEYNKFDSVIFTGLFLDALRCPLPSHLDNDIFILKNILLDSYCSVYYLIPTLNGTPCPHLTSVFTLHQFKPRICHFHPHFSLHVTFCNCADYSPCLSHLPIVKERSQWQ